jgi:tetratricopeptide (TPR) repeat protein
MSLALGDKDGARAQFTDLIADPQGGGAAPDTYIRTVMALASMEAREGNKRAALDALAAGEDFSPNYAPLAALRQLIEADGKPEPGVKTAQQGAAAALFTLGAALNREGAEETVAVYLQFARTLNPDDAATLVILGSLKERLGKMEDAIVLYQMVPEASPMRRVSELQLGLALADMGRNAEAKDHLKSLIASDPRI